jgi:hypothetical protein
MTPARFALSLLILFSLSAGAQAACEDPKDPQCRAIQRATEDARKAIQKAAKDAQAAIQKATEDARKAAESARREALESIERASRKGAYKNGGVVGTAAKPLQPVRAYLRAHDIPPVDAGAYGIVVFHSKPTPASRSKLMMVCNAFKAYFPRSETATVPVNDQMITVWPLDNPQAEQAKNDDCDYVLDHYDLVAAESAIGDAQRQRATAAFDGSGPYLVGWSPSKTRGVPDALVLVVDMSADSSQADIDGKFLFWKTKIVDDPSVWRNGWSIERFRVALHNFAEQYGQSVLDSIKMIGDKIPSAK